MIILDKEKELMIKKEYTVNIGNLKVSGSAEDIHKLANIYMIVACDYGHDVVDEIHGKHRDDFIAELQAEQKEAENIERLLIDTIRDSDYYKEYSSKMSDLMDDILEEIKIGDERNEN